MEAGVLCHYGPIQATHLRLQRNLIRTGRKLDFYLMLYLNSKINGELAVIVGTTTKVKVFIFPNRENQLASVCTIGHLQRICRFKFIAYVH